MITKNKALRLLVIALSSWLIFSYILTPLRIDGQSMEPGYPDGGFRFCWQQQYLFSQPQRGDVVAIRFAGKRVVLLKRIVALAGETVEFQDGVLLVNGRKIKEPYVRYNAGWNLPPRQVAPGKVYVIGDNRGVPIEQHHFGQVATKRILGGVLW